MYLSYQGSNVTYTKRWTHSWLNNAQSVAFLFSPILITSCLHRKHTRFSTRYIFTFWGSLETRLGQVNLQFNSLRLSPSFLHLTVRVSSDGRRGMAKWVHMVCNLAPSLSGCHAHKLALTGSGSGLGRRPPYFMCYVGSHSEIPSHSSSNPTVCNSSTPTLPHTNHHDRKNHW